MECIKCGVTDNKQHLKCDGCERPLHTECSGLNASELKVMGLKGTRTLKFYCEDCLAGVRLVPELINRLDALQRQFDAFKNQPAPVEIPNHLPEESILAEVQERQKRMNNIMMFNLPETNDDMMKASEILRLLVTNYEIGVAKVLRVGKANKNGIRALKITLNNANDVDQVVWAKKGILKGRNVYISADLTPMQNENLKQLKQEMETRKENGENVVIRFIKGVPKIVEDSKN